MPLLQIQSGHRHPIRINRFVQESVLLDLGLWLWPILNCHRASSSIMKVRGLWCLIFFKQALITRASFLRLTQIKSISAKNSGSSSFYSSRFRYGHGWLPLCHWCNYPASSPPRPNRHTTPGKMKATLASALHYVSGIQGTWERGYTPCVESCNSTMRTMGMECPSWQCHPQLLHEMGWSFTHANLLPGQGGAWEAFVRGSYHVF